MFWFSTFLMLMDHVTNHCCKILESQVPVSFT